MSNIPFISLSLFIFTIPIENIVLIQSVGALSKIVGLIAFFLGTVAIIIKNEKIKFNFTHFLFFIFVIICGFSFFYSIEKEATLNRFLTYVQLFFMSWIIFQLTDNQNKFLLLLKSYICGAYIAAILTLINFILNNQVNPDRYAAQGFNPNDIAVIMALGIPLAWYVTLLDKNKINIFFYRSYLFVAPICIALTSSRTGFIATIISFLFLIFTFNRLIFFSKISFLLITLFCIFSGILFLPEKSLERLSSTKSELIEGGLNYRVSIWDSGLEVFTKNPLLGVGSGVFKYAVEPGLGNQFPAHNVYLAILVEQGIIGFLVFLFILLSIFFHILKLPPLERLLWFVIFLIWTVCAFSLNWEWRKQTWLIFSLIVSHAVILKTTKQKTDNAVELLA